MGVPTPNKTAPAGTDPQKVGSDSAPLRLREYRLQNNSTRKGACRCHLLSPRIVGIFYYRRSACVNQLDNIALCVAEVVVFISVVVNGHDIPACVIAEHQHVVILLHQLFFKVLNRAYYRVSRELPS